MILSSEEIQEIERFKEVAVKVLIRELKSATSWRDKDNFKDTIEKYGWTGCLTCLKDYYEGEEGKLEEVVYNLWDYNERD